MGINIGLIIGGTIAFIISLYWSDYINFIVVAVLYGLCILFGYYFVSESLSDKNKRTLLNYNVSNPCRPLFQIGNNEMILYICIVQFLISFMEFGVLNVIIIYILNSWRITKNNSNYIIVFAFIVSVSIGICITSTIIVPYLKKYNIYNPTYISYIIYKSLPNCCKQLFFNVDYKYICLSCKDKIKSKYKRIHSSTNPINIPNNQSNSDHRSDIKESDIDSHIDPNETNTIYFDSDDDMNSNNIDVYTSNDLNIDLETWMKSEQPLFASPPISLSHIHFNTNNTYTKSFPPPNPLNTNFSNSQQAFDLSNDHDTSEDIPIINLNSCIKHDIWGDYNNLIFGVIMIMISMLFVILLKYIQSLFWIIISGIILALGVGTSFPSLNGITTNGLRSDEQGKGFGIVFAIKGLTYALSPFLFANLYNLFQLQHKEYMIFVIAIILNIIALFIIIFPLKRVLIDIYSYGIKLLNKHKIPNNYTQ